MPTTDIDLGATLMELASHVERYFQDRDAVKALIKELPGHRREAELLGKLKAIGQQRVDEIRSCAAEAPEDVAAKLLHAAALLDAGSRDVPRMLTEAVVALQNPIPEDYRTRPTTKAQAARLHAGQKIENPTAYFDRLIQQRKVKAPMGSGHNWQFDIRDFPASAHNKLRRNLAQT